MTPETFLSLVSFAFVMSFTPGPNNIMLTASGANFGLTRTAPHIAGVVLGYAVLLAATGSGLGALITAYPQSQTALKAVGAAYMLWLAWKVANAGGAGEGGSRGRPLSFLQAAAFQWVNPKGIVIALGAIALYVRPGSALGDFATLVAVFSVVTLLSTLAWAAFGVALSAWLRTEQRARIFNGTMAVLLVASIVPMLL